MAAIFMRNVPDNVTEVSMTQGLAPVLHNAPFTQLDAGLQMNFHIFLHPRRGPRAQGHKGTGILTLPSPRIADYFLTTYGSANRRRLPCDAPGRPVIFQLSRGPAKGEIVTLVQNTPYIDPGALHAQVEREVQLSEEVSLSAVQFGWRCRDDQVSIEWDSNLDAPPGLGMAWKNPKLQFKEATRDIRITLGDVHTPVDPATGTAGEAKLSLIVIRWSRIGNFALDPNRKAITIDLERAPSFEVQTAVNFLSGAKESRLPVPSFAGPHKRIAPFVSELMRIEFATALGLEKFEGMATVAGIPSPMQEYSGPIRKNLFSTINLTNLDHWLGSLDWPIAFQLAAIRDNVLADPYELLELRQAVAKLVQQHGSKRTAEVLRLLRGRLAALWYDGQDSRGARTILGCLRSADQDVTALHMKLRDQSKNPGYFDCYHLEVTPTKMKAGGPFPDQSNRVIRRYPNQTNSFVRVSFCDEENLQFRWDPSVQGDEFVRNRVGGILKQGVVIAGRRFKFLHFSQSALKEHAVWFCMEFTDDSGNLINADSIRRSLGDFSHLDRQPARMAARMSQAFTATEPGVVVEFDEATIANDIERNGSNFTDGIGEISKELSVKICKSLQRGPGGRTRFYVKPCAYQFRANGYKGVLAVDYKLDGLEIVLRKSQFKFHSSDPLEIEIAQAFYRPKPAYLNRNLIMILETLGVKAPIFVTLQDKAVRDVESASLSLRTCANDLLDVHGCGTSFRLSSVFRGLSRLGFGFQDDGTAHALRDPFIDRTIEFARNHVLRLIKHKARIPVKDAYTLVGVADIHGYLAPGQVFVCIKEKDKRTQYLTGPVLVTRSPQAHPGDVQFVTAIGAPPPDSPFTREKNPRYNCIVFATTGTRSVPSMLAGGDLDGDEYNVICNRDLFPPKCDRPADYPPAVVKTLNRSCNIDDIADWVAEFINSDIVGLISLELLVRADQSHKTGLLARESGCLKLAEMASAAVDFPKSGTPVDRSKMPAPLYPRAYKPDWSIGEIPPIRNRQLNYVSETALGQLYRRIDLNRVDRLAEQQARQEHHTGKRRRRTGRDQKDDLARDMERLAVDPDARDSDAAITRALRYQLGKFVDIDSPIPDKLTATATEQFEAYVAELRYICMTDSMSRHPLTEEEVVVGTIATKTSQPKKRQNLISELRLHSDELVKRIRAELADEGSRLSEEGGGLDSAAVAAAREVDLEDWLLRSWEAWNIAVRQGGSFGAKSFGIIALGSIFECVRELEEKAHEAGGI